jgi:hypothetical protein
VRSANTTRNAAIRAAQTTYKQRRAAILNDGNPHDDLTAAQHQQLRDAERARDAAIRQAQQTYKVTIKIH